jgi:8-oxo-dGTP diphosphatase
MTAMALLVRAFSTLYAGSIMSKTAEETKRPKVGVAVFIWRDGKVIMNERRGSHGHGTWSIPGGHLEFGETWEECAKREAMEEVGVELTNVRFLAATNDLFADAGKHYISIWLEADWASGEPVSREPEKVIDVQWRSLADLPTPLFEPCWQNLRAAKPEFFAPKP